MEEGERVGGEGERRWNEGRPNLKLKHDSVFISLYLRYLWKFLTFRRSFESGRNIYF